MAKVHPIFIYGDIVHDASQAEAGREWINLKRVVAQINEAKEIGASDLSVRIHSDGGDVFEGFGIHDALINSGLNIHTIVDGNCFSIATVIFLAGSKRSISKNSELMIHNPYGEARGTADEVMARAHQIQDAENKILDFYVLKTGSDRDSLKAMMQVQTSMRADQSIEMKFATDILEPVMAKAKAILHLKEINSKQMTTIAQDIKNGFNEIKNLFKSIGQPIKNAMVKTEGGDELEIDMAGEKVAVGDMVTKNGENFTGTATLKDGTVITCEDGKVTAVTEAQASDDTKETVEDLKAQLTAKDAEIATLTASITDIKTELGTITNHLKTIKTTYTPPSSSGTFNKGANATDPKEETIEEKRAKVEARKKEIQASKK